MGRISCREYEVFRSTFCYRRQRLGELLRIPKGEDGTHTDEYAKHDRDPCNIQNISSLVAGHFVTLAVEARFLSSRLSCRCSRDRDDRNQGIAVCAARWHRPVPKVLNAPRTWRRSVVQFCP
jgi:hypothetical protein